MVVVVVVVVAAAAAAAAAASVGIGIGVVVVASGIGDDVCDVSCAFGSDDVGPGGGDDDHDDGGDDNADLLKLFLCLDLTNQTEFFLRLQALKSNTKH